jgi:hypothetical protein
VRDNKALVNKVSVVKGDIMEPELGLTEVDRAAIVEGVDVIIHCAADIRLECCIQVRRVYVYRYCICMYVPREGGWVGLGKEGLGGWDRCTWE